MRYVRSPTCTSRWGTIWSMILSLTLGVRTHRRNAYSRNDSARSTWCRDHSGGILGLKSGEAFLETLDIRRCLIEPGGAQRNIECLVEKAFSFVQVDKAAECRHGVVRALAIALIRKCVGHGLDQVNVEPAEPLEGGQDFRLIAVAVPDLSVAA